MLRFQNRWWFQLGIVLVMAGCGSGGANQGTANPEETGPASTASSTEAAVASAVAPAVASLPPPSPTFTLPPDLTPEPTVKAVATDVARAFTEEPAGPGPGTPTPQATPLIAFIQPALASHLLEYQVVGEQGDVLGHVTDLAVQFPEGQAVAVVVDAANRGDLLPLPFAAVQPPLAAGPAQERLFHFMGGTPAFENAPALEDDTFNGPQPAWDQEYRRYWESALPESVPPESLPPGEQIALASDLVGMGVVDQGGQEIGQVQDLILDRRSGDLQYLVVSAGGVLGIGEKWIPAPPSVLDYEGEVGRFVLTVEADRLGQAPNVDLAQFPEFPASDWDEDVRAYWGE